MVLPDRAASPLGNKKPQRPQALNLSQENNIVSIASPKDSPTASALKSSFRRTGSLGKSSKKRPTAPQGPSLATEARSLVRPCNCGKDGVFNKVHGHGHDHHHKVPPSPERVRRDHNKVATPRSPLVSRKPLVIERKQVAEKKPVDTPERVTPQKEKKTSTQKNNRFVSTVVWYPALEPEFNTTTLSLNQGEDSSRYIDAILVKEYNNYVKKMFPDNKNIKNQSGIRLMKEEQHPTTFRNSVKEGMQNHSVSVS